MAPRQKRDGPRAPALSDSDSLDWEMGGGGSATAAAAAVLEDRDSDEEELERLVLGDRAGFRARLFEGVGEEEAAGKELVVGDKGDAGAADDDSDADSDLAAANDSHMFLYDEALQPHTSMVVAETRKPADGRDADADAPAWEDSDDERLRVSLAGRSQLRKLRQSAGEDVVSGREYAVRLRQMFLRLHPQPAWAVEAETRRRGDPKDAGSDSEGGDSDESDPNDGVLDSPALPLEALFRSARALMAGATGGGGAAGRRLRPEVLDIQKTRDVAAPHRGAVAALAFHPVHADLLLSASTSSVLHLHQVAPTAHPTPNPLLTAVRVRHTPIQRAEFVVGEASTQVVFAGRRRFFHTWDLASGRVQRVAAVQGHRLEHRSMERFRASPDGRHLAVVATDRVRGGIVNVLAVATMQWVAQARQEGVGGVADVQWWRDGRGLAILGRDGRVGEWCLATRRFVGVWRDDGSTGGTVLALGGRGGPDALGGDRWVAVGSKAGITNIYDRAALLDDIPSSATSSPPPTIRPLPTPRRVLEQLVTPVTTLAFSPDGQLLATASVYKRDALRLVHLPSCTVYRNWPTEKTPLGRITAVAFGRGSGVLAVANDDGKTRLWEIRA